jgi:DNA-nicking Smr family endonuclease
MRSHKGGLADLKRLSDEAARQHETAKKIALRANSSPRNAQAQTSSSSSSPKGQLVSAATSDESKLFARAVRSVQPLSAKHTRLLRKATLNPAEHEQLTERRQRATGEPYTPPQRLSDGASPGQDEEVELTWAASGIGPSVVRQLARVFWPIGARLDLHGLNSDQARSALVNFIANSQNHATRCVCIIHGVGYGSANGQPVLSVRVRQWLKQIPAVSAFVQAPQSYGGAGALLALLKVRS